MSDPHAQTKFVSYAQNLEDVMLFRALRDVPGGFYIDVGAADPTELSVTRAFYDRGWRGINIEPAQHYFERLAADRPRDINLQTAVSDTAGDLAFYRVDGTGLSTIDPDVAAQSRRDGRSITTAAMRALTLGDICAEHVSGDIHFLKIDVEGAEEQVIRGADFERFRPWIVVAEATEPGRSVEHFKNWESLLTAAQYRFAWFDGLNRFYVADEHWDRLGPHFQVQPNVFDKYTIERAVSAEAQVTAALTQVRDTFEWGKTLEAEITATAEREREATAWGREMEAMALATERREAVAVAWGREMEAKALATEKREVAAVAWGQELEAAVRAGVAREREAAAQASGVAARAEEATHRERAAIARVNELAAEAQAAAAREQQAILQAQELSASVAVAREQARVANEVANRRVEAAHAWRRRLETEVVQLRERMSEAAREADESLRAARTQASELHVTLAQFEARCLMAERQARAMEAEFLYTVSSRSWRLTKPVRAVARSSRQTFLVAVAAAARSAVAKRVFLQVKSVLPAPANALERRYQVYRELSSGVSTDSPSALLIGHSAASQGEPPSIGGRDV